MNIALWLFSGLVLGWVAYSALGLNDGRSRLISMVIGAMGGFLGGKFVAPVFVTVAPDGETGETVPAALPGVGDIVTAVGSMNHLAFHVPAEKFDEYRQRLIDKGVKVGPVLNHDNSPHQVAPKMRPGVYVRSFYFTDPDGILLEFACWTADFTEADIAAVPRTAADRHPRHVVMP